MPGLKISQLPSVAIIQDTDQFLLARGDSTRRIPGNVFLTTKQEEELYTYIDEVSATADTMVLNLSSTTFTALSAKRRWKDFYS